MRSKADIDNTDDWMNPLPKSYVSTKVDKDKIEYLIERKKRIPCFGSPGSITRWEYWMGYDTAAERDKALQSLREEHPMWQLRSRDRNPWLESIGMGLRD